MNATTHADTDGTLCNAPLTTYRAVEGIGSEKPWGFFSCCGECGAFVEGGLIIGHNLDGAQGIVSGRDSEFPTTEA